VNKQTRKELARAIELIQEGSQMLADIADAELEKFENLDNLQGSELGRGLEESADALQSAADDVESAIIELENI
jgi:hypothetical protein